MRKKLSLTEQKIEAILSQERSLAAAIAMKLKDSKPISVWEILMPVIFIFNYARQRTERDVFVQNFLFTKKIALNAAKLMNKTGCAKSEALSPAIEEMNQLIKEVNESVYNQTIKEKQLAEIDLLIEHYLLLLRCDGSIYKNLARKAYKTLGKYQNFLNRLAIAENEVSQAAISTLGDKADFEFVKKMREIANNCRNDRAMSYFS